MMTLPVKKKELLALSESLLNQGLRNLIPLGGNLKADLSDCKKPLYKVLPRVPQKQKDGSIKMVASWNALVEQGPTTIEQVAYWLDCGATGIAALCGGTFMLYVFDIDVERFADKWMRGEVNNILVRNKVPFQISGGGGYQIYVRVEETPRAKKLAWIKDETSKSGRSIAIETRGEGNYIVLPFSLHPSRNYYEPHPIFDGSFAAIPIISKGEREALESKAKGTCECPKSLQDVEREKRQGQREAERAKRKKTRNFEKREGPSVIDRYNSATDIEDVLGDIDCYSELPSGRWAYDGGSGSIVVNANNTSSHYSTNDPASDRKAKTPFNLRCLHDFDDDVREAVKVIACELNMDYASQREEERREKAYKAKKVAHNADDIALRAKAKEVGHPSDNLQKAGLYGRSDLGIEPLREPLPEWSSKYEKFDWNEFKSEIISRFDVAEYVKQEFSEAEVIEVDKERNVFYHRGLGVGGGVFQVVCLRMYKNIDTHKHWNQILREAARFAGVQWPDFRTLGCTLNDVLATAFKECDNFYLVELEGAQYVSDVIDLNTLAMGKATHFIGGCGIGKTYAADSVDVKSFYTPMSRQATAFNDSANKRGAYSDVVVEGHMHSGGDSIFGTYDAAKKELELIKCDKNPMSVKGRTCFTDEVQHICHDAYRKSTALEPILEAASIYVAEGGRVVTLSGTPSPAYPGILSYKGSDVIYVRRKNQVKRKLWLFRQSDPVESSLHLIEKGYTHITHSVDDKRKCEAVSQTLSRMGHKSHPIHADNKKEDFHDQYAGKEGEDGKWGDDVRLYITTRATVDGFSIRIGDKERVKVAEVFDSSLQYGSQMIEQRSHRVRDHIADVFIGMSDETLEKLGKGGHFSFQYELDQEMKLAKAELESAKNLRLIKIDILENNGRTPAEKIHDIANKYVMSLFKGRLKFDENGELVVDEMGIIQRVTNEWLTATHETPDIMINELGAYGFEYQSTLDMTGKVEEANEREQAIKLTKAEAKQTELSEVQAFAQEMDLDRARKVCKNAPLIVSNQKGPEKESAKNKVKAAKLIVRLTDNGLSEGEAKRQVVGLTSLRKDKIERIEDRTQLAKIRAAPPELIESADPKVKFLARLQDGETFKLGEALTVSEITQRVSQVAEACGIPEIMVPLKRKDRRKKKGEKRYHNDRQVMKLIKDMYVVGRTKKTVDGKKVYAYIITKFVDLELAYK